MLPSSPKVGSLQVEHRRADDSVHHNRKIDTECFEQGKRRITPLAAARFAHMCRDETGRDAAHCQQENIGTEMAMASQLR